MHRATSRLRARLLAGASAAGLALLSLSTQAAAATTISDTTAPVVTSTANNGQPDDVTITGSVKPAGGAAVTIDSNNTVTNSGGSIAIQGVNGSTGVSILGGHTGGFANSGSILIDEASTAKDNDGDGDIDTPFAVGSDRYGIRLTGTSAFTGQINNAGTLSVIGNDSAGVSIETGLVGDLLQQGSLTAVGSRVVGVNVAAPVTGNVSITGATSASGEAGTALNVSGDVSGRLLLENVISASGYRSTVRPTDPAVLNALDADDLLQGGPAVAIRANIAGGVLLNNVPTADANNTDVDGDGVLDSIQVAGAVSAYGAAPAIVVGATGRDVAIGNVGAGDLAYGLVLKGTILGSGVYDGVSATGLQIGVPGGGAVTTGGGLWLSGTLSAVSLQAPSTALWINSGATVPVIRNDGSIAASVTATGAAAAQGIVIEAGAHVTSLLNAGTLSATVAGAAGDAVALIDRSGSLVDIENANIISATVTPAATTDTVTGRAIAMDLSANTSGVSIVQNSTDSAVAPAITGAVLLGSGSDQMQILKGYVTGDIAFGAGANSLTIEGAGVVKGAITATGGTLNLAVNAGTLQVNNAATLSLTRLNLGSTSTLVLTADPANGTATFLNVSGQADIADGAKIGVRLTSLLKTSATYQLLHADSLNLGAVDSSLIGQLPYLYNAALSSDAAAGTISVALSRKSGAELGLPSGIAGAYEPFVTAIDKDAAVRDAVLAQTSQADLISLYKQFMPLRSTAAFEMAQMSSQSFARAIIDHEASPDGRAWIQEVDFGVLQKATETDGGYHAWGIGFSGGLETAATSLGRLGVTLGGTTSSIDGGLTGDLVEAGVFWRADVGGLRLVAHSGVGYMALKNTRSIEVFDDLGARTLFRQAKADWSGYTTAAGFSASYRLNLGKIFYVEPQASIDYFSLHEGAYSETGGGDAVDLAVSSRTSSKTSATYGVATGVDVRDGQSFWASQLLVGWRSTISDNFDQTIARFISGEDRFATTSAQDDGDGWIARFSVKSGNESGGYGFEGGAEKRGDLTSLDVRLNAHLNF